MSHGSSRSRQTRAIDQILPRSPYDPSGIPAYSRQLREAPLSLLHNSSLRAPFYISETTYAQTQIYDSKNYRFNAFSMAFLGSLLKSFRSSVGQ